jgi:hypothetical protein
MVNLNKEIKYKLLNGIRVPIWAQGDEHLLLALRNQMWSELYHKSVNQMEAMRNISSIVNTKLTKIVVATWGSKIDNVNYGVDFKVDIKLSYQPNGRYRISEIGKQILHRIYSVIYSGNRLNVEKKL